MREWWLHASSDIVSWIGLTIQHHTTIYKAAARIGMTILHILVGRFQWIIPMVYTIPNLTDIDGTGFENHHAAPYYTYGAQLRHSYTKLSAASHLQYQLVQSCAISHRPIHGTRHVRRLLRPIVVPPDAVVADKEYDAEWVHVAIRKLGSYGIIPVRGNNAICRTPGRYRKQMGRCFDTITYGQRNKCETIFSVIKRRFGFEILAHKNTIKEKELLFRIIAYNCHRTVLILCVVLVMISM